MLSMAIRLFKKFFFYGFLDILLNENIYISALSSLENPGRYIEFFTCPSKLAAGVYKDAIKIAEARGRE